MFQVHLYLLLGVKNPRGRREIPSDFTSNKLNLLDTKKEKKEGRQRRKAAFSLDVSVLAGVSELSRDPRMIFLNFFSRRLGFLSFFFSSKTED